MADGSTVEAPFEADSTTDSYESADSPAPSDPEVAASDVSTDSSLSDSLSGSAVENVPQSSMSDGFSIDDMAGDE